MQRCHKTTKSIKFFIKQITFKENSVGFLSLNIIIVFIFLMHEAAETIKFTINNLTQTENPCQILVKFFSSFFVLVW